MIVLIRGLYLWVSRRRTPVEKELDRLVALEDLSPSIHETGALAQ